MLMYKIALINKFYYPRGGDCTYTIQLERLLKEKGHEVAIFAMDHPDTLPTAYRKYFPSEINFSPQNPGKILETVLRPFGTKEVKKKFNRLLNDFQPDIVHLGNIHSQLSPLVAKAAHKRGIKVIWTLHDYKLLCPRYDCLRNGKMICEECFHNTFSVLRYSCMKNSKFASVLAYLEALKWNKSKLERYTDMFICPSEFMKSVMVRGGYRTEKLNTIHHFIHPEQLAANDYSQPSDYYCYLGRISHEKGVETLLKAASQLPYKLKIIGSGPSLSRLITKYQSDHIEFLGYKNWEEIKSILKNACFLVSPSEWYEVLGLNNIEALCLGVPVLASNIGGIPELIRETENGMLFEPTNVDDLKQKIIDCWNHFQSIDNKKIAIAAQEKFTAEKYYEQLMKLYAG